MRLNAILSAVVAAFAASGASAQLNIPFAMPMAPQLPFTSGMPAMGAGPFDHRWIFTAPTGSQAVSGAAVSVNLKPFFNIEDILIGLYTSGGTLVTMGAPGASSSLQSVPVASGAGYYFKVTGNVTQAPNGHYAFSAIAAVPEPETYAMMLAGVAAVAFVAMRRRRRD